MSVQIHSLFKKKNGRNVFDRPSIRHVCRLTTSDNSLKALFFVICNVGFRSVDRANGHTLCLLNIFVTIIKSMTMFKNTRYLKTAVICAKLNRYYINLLLYLHEQ